MIKMGGDDKEITITYETLYEFLRREKNREDIQELDKGFINNVKSYLTEKRSMLYMDRGQQMLFSEEEQKKTLQQITNIIKVLRELYDRRERKITDLAMNKSKTNSDIIDTNKLLDGEKEMYSQMVDVFNLYRAKLLYSMVDEGRAKNMLSKIDEQKGKFKRQQYESSEMQSSQHTPENQIEELNKEEKSAETQKTTIPAGNDTVNLKFISQVQRFIDAQLKVHGPFEPGDTAEVPVAIAEVLIKKGSAQIN